MSNHSIRRATAADFGGVMAMGDVLFGIDYLKHRYHSFMNDPNVTSYVYIVGDEIVGFCSAFLIDDGMTLLLRASRVKDGFKGQGLYGKLTKHVYAEYRNIPSIKYEAFATHNKNYEVKKESLKKSYCLLYERVVLNYSVNASGINLPELLSDENTQDMTSSDMTAILSAYKTHSDLFPDGKMHIDRVPLRLIPSNVKYIITDETHALKTENDDCKALLLTVGTSTPCKLGVLYFLDVFGSDVIALRHHFLNHLLYIKTYKEGNIIFSVVSDPKMKEAVDEIAKELNLPESDLATTGLFSFERAFDGKHATKV